MHWRNWIGVPAGMFILIVGFYVLGPVNPCYLNLDRTSYIGDIQIAPEPAPPVLAPDATEMENAVEVENPYGMQICDYWPSSAEKILMLAAPLFLLLIAGATAARIGPTISRWRGVVAPAAAVLLIAIVGEDSLNWMQVPIGVSIAGVLGLAGAEGIRFWQTARK
jgi:hypothetical protein